MNEKIIISVQYTAEDFARGAKHIQKRNSFVRYLYLLPLLPVFGTLLFLFIKDPQKTVYVFSRPQGFMPIVLAFVIAAPILYFLNRRKYSYLVKKQYERQINSSPVLQTEKTIIFDEEGMIAHSGLGGGNVDWNAFIEATETEDYFYFFTAKKIAQMIPKRSFESENQQNQLRELAKQKLGDRAKF